jgi:predicted nucleic acid-binding Zn ribbon protein
VNGSRRGGEPEGPTPVGAALERVVAALGGPSVRGLTTLFDRWDEIVGERVATHARPHGLDDGVLVVAVDEPGWATQLRFLEGELLRRLEEALGPGVVRSLVVRTTGPTGGPGRGRGGRSAGR